MATRQPSNHDHRLACVSVVPLFADLQLEDRRRIAAAAMTRTYAKGEQIHDPGTESGLRVVHQGRVKVHRVSESGVEQLLRILRPGDFFGETTLLTGHPMDSWAVSLEPAEVCTVPRSSVVSLLRERPEVAMRMLGALSERLAESEQQLSAVTGATVGRRLVDHLLELAAESGDDAFTLPTTKKDLASYLGTTPETLSRRLHGLQDAGVLRLGSGGRVEIIDRGGLRAAGAGA